MQQRYLRDFGTLKFLSPTKKKLRQHRRTLKWLFAAVRGAAQQQSCSHTRIVLGLGAIFNAHDTDANS
jgi:hypothetical protein